MNYEQSEHGYARLDRIHVQLQQKHIELRAIRVVPHELELCHGLDYNDRRCHDRHTKRDESQCVVKQHVNFECMLHFVEESTPDQRIFYHKLKNHERKRHVHEHYEHLDKPEDVKVILFNSGQHFEKLTGIIHDEEYSDENHYAANYILVSCYTFYFFEDDFDWLVTFVQLDVGYSELTKKLQAKNHEYLIECQYQ